ncbi:MAG: MlaD family protein [Solirubrobacterales bacterium]
MRGGPIQRLTASPVLVGALTTLIVIVAVFLAYNANTGLPFVPTYQVSAIVSNANSLVRNNDVRVGGVRVGTVQAVTPIQNPDGSVDAKLDLKLDKSVEPLPVDSTFVVRSRSALGLKYLQITPGHSSQGLPQGGTLPIGQARPEPVEIDQVFNTFQASTRRNIQRNLVEFGGAVAGRGSSLNAAIGQLRPLVYLAIPVMRNLSSPQTDLAGFLRGLEALNSELAPVAEEQASMFVALDRTFAALASVARPFIQESISRGVETENATIEILPRIRPFLVNSAGLFNDLAPGARALAENSPALAQALTVGAPVLRASPALNNQLPPTSEALLKFGKNPNVTNGLTSLSRTTKILEPTLRFVVPAQSVCNYATILLENSSKMWSSGNSTGKWLRTITIMPPIPVTGTFPNGEAGPSSAPANGPDERNHLHYNPLPNTAAPGQSPHECEAGNEPFLAGQTVIGNVPGNQGTKTSGQVPSPPVR